MDNTRIWHGIAWIGWACEPMVRFQVTAASRDEAEMKALDMLEHQRLLRPGEPMFMKWQTPGTASHSETHNSETHN